MGLTGVRGWVAAWVGVMGFVNTPLFGSSSSSMPSGMDKYWSVSSDISMYGSSMFDADSWSISSNLDLRWVKDGRPCGSSLQHSNMMI